MNFDELPIGFECAGAPLEGVLCRPESAAQTGVVIVVGGPQYRAGSHRQFVLLARALAQAGYPVLRFDYRGMGDSGGAARSFDSVSEDIACALSGLGRAMHQIERFVLWGLCDGASAALMYIERTRDPRVAGLCLVNPWVRSEASLARTQVKHYYTRRLMQRQFWSKLFSGQVGATAVRGLASSMGRALRGGPDRVAGQSSDAGAGPYQQRMAAAWQRFDGRILLILSGNDLTAKEFLEFVASDAAWQGALSRPNVERRDLADADHTFSSPALRQQAEALTLAWLRSASRKAL